MKRLLSQLKIRFRGVWVPMFMNVAGMTVAMVAAIVMLAQVRFDATYDTFHRNADSLFSMQMVYPTNTPDSVGRTTTLPMPVVEQLIKDVPGVKTVSFTLMRSTYKTWHGSDYDFSHPYFRVDGNFVRMFDFDIVAGDVNVFSEDENAVLIPESVARKQWGTVDVVGRVIAEEPDTVRIAAVYKDFPHNSLVKNNLYRPLDDVSQAKADWDYWMYEVWVELDTKADVSQISARIAQNFEALKPEMAKKVSLSLKKRRMELIPIHELHYVSEMVEANDAKMSKNSVKFMFVISVVVLLIAGFNFANFSIARIPRRVKNVNMRRLLGATRIRLVGGIIGESVLQVAISWVMAVVIIIAFADEWMFGVASNRLYLTEIIPVFVYTFGVAVLLGILIGLYPAIKLTRLSPSTALKRHFGLSRSNRALQDVLLTLQMFCSLTLIICSYTMLQQDKCLKSGGNVDKAHLLFAYMKDTIPDAEPLYEKLNAIPGVNGTALSLRILTSQDQYLSWRGQDGVYAAVSQVSYNYLDVMGINITEGRSFDKNDGYAVIMNEAARRRFPDKVAVGKRSFTFDGFDGFEIVGICEDVNFKSLRNEIEPLAFVLSGGDELTCVNVRIADGYNPEQMKTVLGSALDEADANYSHTFRSLDDIYSSTYRYETLTAKRILLFALVAILISLMGLCAMVIVDGEYGVKDIAVKRVNGASVWQLLAERLKRYAVMLAIACVGSCVVYYLYMDELWLSRFHYHVEFSWWLCVVPLLISASGVILLASVLMLRYFRIHPAPILQYE